MDQGTRDHWFIQGRCESLDLVSLSVEFTVSIGKGAEVCCVVWYWSGTESLMNSPLYRALCIRKSFLPLIFSHHPSARAIHATPYSTVRALEALHPKHRSVLCERTSPLSMRSLPSDKLGTPSCLISRLNLPLS